VTTEITVRQETTFADVRAELPHGGDYGLVRDGDEWLLWLDVDVDGLITINDYGTSIGVFPDENPYAMAVQWLAVTA